MYIYIHILYIYVGFLIGRVLNVDIVGRGYHAQLRGNEHVANCRAKHMVSRLFCSGAEQHGHPTLLLGINVRLKGHIN